MAYEIEGGEQEQRFVRFFVGRPIAILRGRIDYEVIKPFDGGVGIHGRRKAFEQLDGKEKSD